MAKGATEVAKQVAKKAADEIAKHPDIAKAVGATVVAGGKAVAKRTPGSLRPLNAHKAERHAWTLEGGQFSKNITVCGRTRCVVWKDGVAVACYPPLTVKELNGTPIGGLAELTGVKTQLRIEPRPPLSERLAKNKR